MPWPHNGIPHRPAVLGRTAVVSSAHQLSSAAGIAMLEAGGNAVDAAIAMAICLSVVEPHACGPGGSGIMMIAEPGADKPTVLDFIGPAPGLATLDAFAEPGSKNDGIRACIIPGAVGGWFAALERFGRLSPEVVFAPAISYARNGFPVSSYLHRFFQNYENRLRATETTGRIFLPNGRVPQTGELLVQTDLARSLEAIAQGGPAAFYEGEIAAEIAAFSKANGGLLREGDFRRYAPHWCDPVSSTFRGYAVFAPPPPSSAIQWLLALNMFEAAELGAMDPNGPEYIHLAAEIFKLATADRIRWIAGKDGRWRGLLDKSYASSRLGEIDLNTASEVETERFRAIREQSWISPGTPPLDRECTTHFVAMDEEGWVVACTQTLGSAWGGGIVHGSTGIALNSLMHWFDDHPQGFNPIGPHKTLKLTLSPSQIWSGGKPFAAIGTPGAWRILQTTPQLVQNLLGQELDIQSAIEAPRFFVPEGRRIALEGRFPDVTFEELRRKGHSVERLLSWDRTVGGAHGVMRDPDTLTFFGGADPRRDGVAMGLSGSGAGYR